MEVLTETGRLLTSFPAAWNCSEDKRNVDVFGCRGFQHLLLISQWRSCIICPLCVCVVALCAPCPSAGCRKGIHPVGRLPRGRQARRRWAGNDPGGSDPSNQGSGSTEGTRQFPPGNVSEHHCVPLNLPPRCRRTQSSLFAKKKRSLWVQYSPLSPAVQAASSVVTVSLVAKPDAGHMIWLQIDRFY